MKPIQFERFLKNVLLLPVLLIVGINAQPCFADYLSGSVEHERFNTGLNQELLPGNVFDERNLGPMHTRRCWYLIPNWFAGVWHRESESVDIGFLHLSHPSRRNRIRGMQVDSLGRIWHACDEPNEVVVDGARVVDYKVIDSMEPAEVSERSVTMQYSCRSVQVNKATGTIVRSYLQKGQQTFTRKQPGVIQCWDQAQMFGPDGRAIGVGQGNGHFEEVLVKTFRPIDVDDHRNYAMDFLDFLREINHLELVPDRLKQ